MRAPALRLRHAGREPFKGEDEELTFPARLPPHADSHRSQNFALWRWNFASTSLVTPNFLALSAMMSI